MTDTEATAKFEIRDAIAVTSHLTGLQAGEASEILVGAIFEKIANPATNWSFREIVNKSTA